MLDTSGIDTPQKQGPYATAFRYNFSQPNTPTVRFHGIIPLDKIEDHVQLVESTFGIGDQSLPFLKDLTLTYIWDIPCCTHLVPYDPRTKLSDYCGDLALHLSLHSELTELFSPRINYNAKYSLPSDSPLTTEQLLQIDSRNKSFVKFSDFESATLSDQHQEVAGIQLIPQVPEDIRRTFHLGRRLYVYGYLEYGFYTVSSHYAHLALDAALHARWSATLPPSVLLTWHDKKTGKLQQQTMVNPSHTKIHTFCKSAGWRESAVKVDGKPFPHTVKLVIDRLADTKVITSWQRKMIREVDVQIRNSLTHLEFAPIYAPSADDLERAAETINQLFDSLPIAASAASR